MTALSAQDPDAWDLDAYFRRIGYRGPREPSLQVLAELARLHPQHIPFENLSPWLGLPVLLDVQSVQRKLLHQRRGGYCFEQNLLLQGMLQALGFEVTALAARVKWRRPPGEVAPRSHMLLRVDVEGEPFIVDAGFGGMTLNQPLRLHEQGEQRTPLEPFRLVRTPAGYDLEARLPSGWSTLYGFDLQEQLRPDFEVVSWYLCHHPDSHFRANLFAARVNDGGRTTLLNNRLTRHRLHAASEERILRSVDEVVDVLGTVFGIEVPDVDAARGRLARLVDGGA